MEQFLEGGVFARIFGGIFDRISGVVLGRIPRGDLGRISKEMLERLFPGKTLLKIFDRILGRNPRKNCWRNF